MKKIALVFALLFFLATVSMASAAPVKVVTIRELCRSDETIIYGIFDTTDNHLIDSIEANGYLDLITAIKVYELKNDVKLMWNYYTNKKTDPGSGTFEINCS